MPWAEVLKFLGGTAAIALTIGYLGRKAIEAYLAGRLESHRSDLLRATNEHSIRFQALHAERGQVLKTIYEKLVQLDEYLHSALRFLQVKGDRSLNDKVQDISRAFNDLRKYYLPRQIFLEKSLCAKIDAVLDLAKGIFLDVTTYPVDPADPTVAFDRAVLQERHVFWDRARTAHNTEFAALKGQLEDEFRRILGLGA
jgi:hypothetical protein